MRDIVSFRNRGLIDMRAVTTFGVSSKENKNPIGYFGTGLKYAIAICLRLGCEIEIFCGQTRFAFSSIKERIRVDDFDIIHMNNIPLGFTTELGKNWESWQAFREIYCNTFDEEEAAMEATRMEPIDGHTTVVVRGEAFMEAYHGRDEIILRSTPVYDFNGIEVHPQSSEYIFYRGVRVGEFSKRSMRTYNIIEKLTLTEDRTVDSTWKVDNKIRDAILNSPDPDFIHEVLYANKGSYEAELDLRNGFVPPNREFMDSVNSAKWSQITNKSSIDLYNAYNNEGPKEPDEAPLDPDQVRQLKEAVDFCRRLSLYSDEFTLVPTRDLRHNNLGMCRLNDNKIFINIRAFTLGRRALVGVLIEEFLHLSAALEDESREMQNHLLNLTVELGEKLLKAKR